MIIECDPNATLEPFDVCVIVTAPRNIVWLPSVTDRTKEVCAIVLILATV